MMRWRRLSSSFVPTALSVRNTNVPARVSPRTAWQGSNHARATAAVAARLGLDCVLVANGTQPERPTANALLDRLLGAEVRYVASRAERAPAMEAAASELRARGRRPFVIPLGASTPHG